MPATMKDVTSWWYATVVHPPKAVEQNEMQFCTDTHVAVSSTGTTNPVERRDQ